jgi:hypothetical protein
MQSIDVAKWQGAKLQIDSKQLLPTGAGVLQLHH